MWFSIKNVLRSVKTYLGISMLTVALTMGFSSAKPEKERDVEPLEVEESEKGKNNKWLVGLKEMYEYKKANSLSFWGTVGAAREYAKKHQPGLKGMFGLLGNLNDNAKERFFDKEMADRRKRATEEPVSRSDAAASK